MPLRQSWALGTTTAVFRPHGERACLLWRCRSSVPEGERPWAGHPGTRGALLLQRYLDLVDQYETPSRIVRAHMHKMLGDWLQVCLAPPPPPPILPQTFPASPNAPSFCGPLNSSLGAGTLFVQSRVVVASSHQ